MTVNRTTLLDLPLPVTGTESGTWGDTTNNGLSQYTDIAIAGMTSLTSANFTAGALTIANTLGDSSATNIAAGSAQFSTIKVSSLAQNSTITAPGNSGTPPVYSGRSYRIINADATYSLTIKASGQTGVTFLPGQTGVVAFNGTDYVIVGVVGAGSTTDNTVPRFDGTTGEILQSSGVTIDDSNNVSGVAQLNITTLDATNIEVTNIKAKDGTAAATIADSTGVVTVTAAPVMTALTASQAVFTTAGKALTSNAITGTGNVVMSASPTLTGTISAAAATLSGNLTLSGGTANGVLYLDGSKVATSGSALTFDGTTLTSTTSAATAGNFKATSSTAQVFNATASNDVNTTIGLGVFGSAASSFGMIAAGQPLLGTAASDLNIYSSNASGVIKFGLGSTPAEQMRLTSTGLGIGTSSPNYKLNVNGSSTGFIQLTNNSTGTTSNDGLLVGNDGTGAYIVQRENDFLSIWTNNTERMRLDSSGNLGLGVTPSAWGSGYKAVQLSALSMMSSSVNGNIVSNAYFNGTNWIYTNNAYATNYYSNYANNGSHVWSIAPSGTAGNAITFTQAMTLDASGNLEIGGTFAQGRRLNVDSSNNGYTVSLLQTGAYNSGSLAGTVYAGYYDGSSITDMASIRGGKENATSGNYAGMLAFYTRPNGGSDTERARIDSSGNLLVGTTSGSYHRFHKSSASDFAVQSANTSATTPYVHLLTFTAAAPNDATSMFLRCDDTGQTGRIQLRSNGGIANYSANDVNLSDRREKTNFAPASEYLSKICAIPVQTFNYIDQNMEDDPGLTLGVVAQDVQAVAPELVMESNWGTKENPKMRLSIYQTDLQYALMKCIQEQQALIESLTTRVSQLEGTQP